MSGVGEMLSEMEKLKSQVKKIVYEKGNLTIDDICKELNYEDDFEVTAAVARLELEGDIISNGEKIAYDPDGRGILLGTYGKRNS